MKRRTILAGGALTGLASLGLWRALYDPNLDPHWQDDWNSGPVRLILPSASSSRFLISVVTRESYAATLRLSVNNTLFPGRIMDSSGHHLTFDVRDLDAATEYTLQFRNSDGEALTDSWPLKTFPSSDSKVGGVRVLLYSCLGGADQAKHPLWLDALFQHSTVRRRLLRRALAFNPDLTVAIGDHVYWDMLSSPGRAMGRSVLGRLRMGRFDRTQPILGTKNEAILKRVVERQIPAVYGTQMRSTPCFFLQDDHDYFENDEASESLQTFPPNAFMLDAAATTQALYYPALFGNQIDDSDERSPSFGSLRYGNLLEMLMYDCRRNLSYGDGGRLLSDDIEQWALTRTEQSDATHLFHVPSIPVQWTAGKLGEWYPDSIDKKLGTLSVSQPKPYWSSGWLAQHDRLLSAISRRDSGLPLVISGDLHATALGEISGSGQSSFADNPIISVLAGSMGTAHYGWPSVKHGVKPGISKVLSAKDYISPIEENGFTLMDVTADSVTLSQFRWDSTKGVETIDSLMPFSVKTFHSNRRIQQVDDGPMSS